MLTIKRVGITVAMAAFAFACALAATPAKADTTSDRAAALLVWPKIVVDPVGVCVDPSDPNSDGRACSEVACDSTRAFCQRTDTLIQVTNLNSEEGAVVSAHCFYINSNSHCSHDGSVCTSSLDCVFGDGYIGVCRAGWNELNFDIRLSQDQPLVWSALDGLGGSDLPHEGNRGTRVPPVPEVPFIGEMKCVQTDVTSANRWPEVCNAGECPNDLIGHARIEHVNTATALNEVDAKWYNAVGLRNLGANDGNGELLLGSEYEACPGVLVLNHLFDLATDPISGNMPAVTELSLAPCSEDLLRQTIDPVTAQFLVYNEFEQRFSTSMSVPCLVDTVISKIDTSQSNRSIFSAGVAGTVAGQTRIQGVNGGLLGTAVVNLGPAVLFDTPTFPLPTVGAAYNLNQVGGQRSGDVIVIP